jgi:cytochrome c oxidase subunit 1
MPVLAGIVIVGFSSIFTGLNFIVTVHTLRAKGMSWTRMPLFVWTIYGTAVIMVLATPVLGMTLLLVLVENWLSTGIFDPARGGDPVLFQHLFWFYSHPAVYIMVLPAMGVVSEVVPACAHRPPLNYNSIAISTFGISFVGFLTWGHHMFVSGESAVGAGIFGFLSMVVAIFTAIKVFTWVGTLYRGAITFTTALAYVCGFIFLIIFGGMTGIAVATVGLDAHWHDTYFVVAHFHFVMAGSVVMAFLAALFHWFPKMFGRRCSERFGLVSAFLVLMGFAGTFTPQFLLGNMGMPRRYYSYPESFHALHVAATVGSGILAAGMGVALLTLLHGLFWGERSGENPLEAATFEWETASPPPEHNFARTPLIERGPYDYARMGKLRAS